VQKCAKDKYLVGSRITATTTGATMITGMVITTTTGMSTTTDRYGLRAQQIRDQILLQRLRRHSVRDGQR